MTDFSGGSLVLAIGCTFVVAVDVIRRPQPMGVMNVVWPVTMLFGSVIWLVFYLRRGRGAPCGDETEMADRPVPAAFAVGTSHCGAGCSLGDLVGEFALVLLPGLATVVGLGWLWSDQMFAAWTVDLILAYLFGIVLQYFSIAPMRSGTRRQALIRAAKADTLSITAWQVGMYALMALLQLAIFPSFFGGRADPLTPEFWRAMQLAMIAGFLTAYPVNWLLISRGVKEKM